MTDEEVRAIIRLLCEPWRLYDSETGIALGGMATSALVDVPKLKKTSTRKKKVSKFLAKEKRT